MTFKESEIVKKAATIAHEIHKDDKDATTDFFVNDYTEAILSKKIEDKAELYFAVASLGLVEDAEKLTHLTEDEANSILQNS